MTVVLGLAAAAACRSERDGGGATDSVAVAADSAAADRATPVATPPADSATPRVPVRDSAPSSSPAGPAGIYVGGPRTGQEISVTLQPNGQYVALVRSTSRGTMSFGRYSVAGDSIIMVPDRSLAGTRRMVAVLRGDSLTVNPSTKPVLLRRRRGLLGDAGVAPPSPPR